MRKFFALSETKIIKAFMHNLFLYNSIEIRKAYKTKLPDAIIVATALVNTLTIVTRNTKDFDEIEGLEVLNPFNI